MAPDLLKSTAVSEGSHNTTYLHLSLLMVYVGMGEGGDRVEWGIKGKRDRQVRTRRAEGERVMIRVDRQGSVQVRAQRSYDSVQVFFNLD